MGYVDGGGEWSVSWVRTTVSGRCLVRFMGRIWFCLVLGSGSDMRAIVRLSFRVTVRCWLPRY